MSQIIEKTGKSVEEAIQLALDELQCDRDEAEIEVLAEPAKGLWGILSTKEAKVRVWKKDEAPADEAADEADGTTGTTGTSDAKADGDARDAGFVPADVEGDKVYQFISEVTRLMGIEASVDKKENDEAIHYALNGPRMGLIIGRRGETLDALQYLTNIYDGRGKEYPRKRIIVDAEDYRRRREDTLIRLATRLATKAKRSGRRVVLEPMNPQERRVIHTALEKDPDVKSFSEGEEPYRRLVISPISGEGRGDSRYNRGGGSWERDHSDDDDE